MPLLEIFRVALQSIRANLFRAALTMLGVIIGVAAVITMVALGSGAQRAIDEQLNALGANILTVSSGLWFQRGVSRNQNTITMEDAELLGRDTTHLVAVVPEMTIREQIKVGGSNLNVSVTGTTPNYARSPGLRTRRRADVHGGRRRRAAARRGGRRRDPRHAGQRCPGHDRPDRADPRGAVRGDRRVRAQGCGRHEQSGRRRVDSAADRAPPRDRLRRAAVHQRPGVAGIDG